LAGGGGGGGGGGEKEEEEELKVWGAFINQLTHHL
jgi:hypothetical protein